MEKGEDYSRKPGFTETRLRPLARRLEITARPLLVFMRERNPCVFERRRRLGWNVRFGITKLRSSITKSEIRQTQSISVQPSGPQLSRITHKEGVAEWHHAMLQKRCKVNWSRTLHCKRCKKFFLFSNIHEINHSHFACPHITRSPSCTLNFSC